MGDPPRRSPIQLGTVSNTLPRDTAKRDQPCLADRRASSAAALAAEDEWGRPGTKTSGALGLLLGCGGTNVPHPAQSIDSSHSGGCRYVSTHLLEVSVGCAPLLAIPKVPPSWRRRQKSLKKCPGRDLKFYPNAGRFGHIPLGIFKTGHRFFWCQIVEGQWPKARASVRFPGAALQVVIRVRPRSAAVRREPDLLTESGTAQGIFPGDAFTGARADCLAPIPWCPAQGSL